MATSSRNEDHRPHFVLVHGVCHGAWSWLKLKPLLEASGHRVTCLDMAASGDDKRKIQEINSISEYSQPLLDFMASLPSNQKVILVGHSFGGINLALAMENFPNKIFVAIFVTAFLPDTIHNPSYTLDMHFERIPQDIWMDSKFEAYGSVEEPSLSFTFGDNFLSSNVYQLSPVKDLELGKTKVRQGTLFLKDLSQKNKFSDESYASIPRVYVVCKEDKLIPEHFQRWMIENSGATQVKEIDGADHMPMFSKTQELCDVLLEIAKTYA